MAATLAHIKSKSLLPAPPPGQEDELDEEGLDPRADLIRRLLEYQKYKQAAADLNDRGALGRDVFMRGAKEPEADGPAPLDCQPYVVFHLWPGGFRSELREWPQDRWRELAQIMAREGLTIVLTGGPGDRARTDAFIESCGADLAPHMVSIAGEFKIPELVNVIADARCVVSVNTGVMHLAGGVGVPTIALNGPTNSLRWGPLGRDVICIDSELPGCGFLDLGFTKLVLWVFG